MLERLGVPADDDRVYLALLRHPGLTKAGVAEQTGLGDRVAQGALARLVELGVVTQHAGCPAHYFATAPDTAVEMLLGRHQEAAALARAEARRLLETPPHLPGDARLEIVPEPHAVRAHIRHLLGSAEHEVLILDRPPFAAGPDADQWSDLVRPGVQSRRVCAPGALEWAEPSTTGRGQVRVHEQLPTELLIVDRTAAVLPFADSGSSVLVVRSSTLLAALVRLFELLWQISVPASGDTGAQGTDDRLLALLAAGLKDEAIARQLGVSLRTVHRRTSELLDRLGVRTRFQAGIEVARRSMPAEDGTASAPS